MNYPDRVCRLYNYLIPNIVNSNNGSNLIDVKLYHDYDRFILRYIIKNEYNNPRLLFDAILHTTDLLLDWVDLTSLGDSFKIRVDYQLSNKTVVFENYYELMSSACILDYKLHTFTPIMNEFGNHPRVFKLEEYLINKQYQEERRKFQMEISEPSRNIEEYQKTFFGKFKNKFVDLFHV